MSLLRDIQATAIDSSKPLSDLLRKCKVLAARLRNQEFSQWVDRELGGYESNEQLPPYRVLSVNSKGDFSGPFKSGLRNVNIPLGIFPEELREGLGHAYLRGPIAALESLVENDKTANLIESWNPDLVAHFAAGIYEGMNCLDARKVIPAGAIVGALDAVRTRVLNFALEIEREAPDAGEAAPNVEPVRQELVHQIFNTYISGDVQNLANASSGTQLVLTLGEKHRQLFEDLVDALRGMSDTEATRAALNAVDDMARSRSRQDYSQAYLQFMSVLSDHAQVLGPAIAPFLAQLASLLN